jgi:hypothetical protein
MVGLVGLPVTEGLLAVVGEDGRQNEEDADRAREERGETPFRRGYRREPTRRGEEPLGEERQEKG